MRIAALIKQVPRFETMQLGPDGRLLREGLELEMNPYCRRAVAKGIELARSTGGTCTVITLGPSQADAIVREAIACGADEGVLVCDAEFAGSDTLATSRALAATLRRHGPFDLILVGRNSVDADTGQVGPAIAELLGLPFLSGVRELELTGRELLARCEVDDGWLRARTALPALISVAERLCSPAKGSPEAIAAVPSGRVIAVSAAELGSGPWGQAGSPTQVGEVRTLGRARDGRRFEGSVAAQVRAAVALLEESNAMSGPRAPAEKTVEYADDRSGPPVVVVAEPDRARVTAEVLGKAAVLARQLGGRVVAFGPDVGRGTALGAAGADEWVGVVGDPGAGEIAAALATWAAESVPPWAVLAPSTAWGREVAARAAARLGAGLVGDAVDLEVREGRLVAWKPAFGGALVASITTRSPVQMVTVRPGVLPLLEPRDHGEVRSSVIVPAASASRVDVVNRVRDDEIEVLSAADIVIGVGSGVPPEEYSALEPLRQLLHAEFGATRKVTDRGWLPRSRQIGITGRAIAPRLYVAVAVQGKYNHMLGVRSAGTILAVNRDPTAPVFAVADVGIVGDWRDVVPQLVEEIASAHMPAVDLRQA